MCIMLTCFGCRGQGARMAFKQMENIGWFLEKAREYGVPESDLFMTVDLFEGGNMRQVAQCINALKMKISGTK